MAGSINSTHKLARLSLFSFIVTFILSRVFVFLIMAQLVPNMYFFMHGTHVHHLNYGIFLLAAICGFSIFGRPTGRTEVITALGYGIALGLTFDEFGMWLHLGGSYWQRASVDAVIVIGALMGFIGFASTIRTFEAKHIRLFIALALVVVSFVVTLFIVGDRIGSMVGPKLQTLESESSP